MVCKSLFLYMDPKLFQSVPLKASLMEAAWIFLTFKNKNKVGRVKVERVNGEE